MLESSSAWKLAAVFAACVSLLPGTARAADEPRCSAWRSAGKPYERIALRTCAPADDDPYAGGARAGEAPAHAAVDQGAGEKDEEPADEQALSLEIRNGYPEAHTIRYELVASDGAHESAEATLKSGVNPLGECGICREHGDLRAFRVALAAASGEPPARDAEALRKVAGTTSMDVVARDLRLTDTNAERLKRIAARYFRATHKRLVVTGGTRTPQRQAQLMLAKLKRGEDIVAHYENTQAALEIRDVYRDGTSRRLTRKQMIRAIKSTISAQIERGVFVSKHLHAGAVDVRSWNMEGDLEQALREAVKQEPGVTLMDEREGPEPHFHLNLPPAP